ncbi:MAG: undecaprenyldiphospho-muramoylpentapeptide beta-N-acetylglucosaminyltransferase [Phormidesmis sp. CAN_BIN36]|nr:undecaprenyldiphospho-muramoylpentapeptide beta-N-acetylglucosaminyltransferase [Phormidesmis sp. CAN_BIN36]
MQSASDLEKLVQSTSKPIRLLIAASGTGGHVFPAIATAEQLPDYQIEWLGVPDRLETQLVGDPSKKGYPLHTIAVAGFQQKLGLGTLKVLLRLIGSIRQVRTLLKQGKFDGVFTTGGYIAAPAILAARSLGLPVILHESNALPGKVTRWFAPWCSVVAIGFEAAAQYLPRSKTICVGTPVRSQFRSALDNALEDLSIPKAVSLIVVVGVSQGAVALNKLVRKAAPAWFAAGAWVVHLTGDSDPDAQSLQHSQYVVLPFYDHMAALFQRANLAISRSGAGTLTELAITHTPSILIPYPFAAEDHQAFNAAVFAKAGAAEVDRQADLTPEVLETQVLTMLKSPDRLQQMAKQAASLAVVNSAEQLAQLIRQHLT